MNFWKVTIEDTITGNRDTNDPIFLVCTTGGSSELEIIRQIDEALEMVRVSAFSLLSHEMDGKRLVADVIEFDALGVARL